MTLTNQQLDTLLNMLSLTQETEITCDQCHQKMAEFAERWLPGKSISEGMLAIEAHLEICGECRQEFEALKAALSSNVDPPEES